MTPSIAVAVSIETEFLKQVALKWGAYLDCPVYFNEDVLIEDAYEYDFILWATEDGLALQGIDNTGSIELSLDFLNDKTRYWRKGFRGKNEPIARAIGAKPSQYIWDVTAGLAVDSLTIVRLGHRVLALERSKVLYALLSDAHERALDSERFSENFKRIEFQNVDSIRFLKAHPASEKPDCIYIDPMFPEERRKAKPKGDLQLIRRLVGKDPDAEQLLTLALKYKGARVVIKRPGRSDHLVRSPEFIVDGKAFRFDVYFA